LNIPHKACFLFSGLSLLFIIYRNPVDRSDYPVINQWPLTEAGVMAKFTLFKASVRKTTSRHKQANRFSEYHIFPFMYRSTYIIIKNPLDPGHTCFRHGLRAARFFIKL